ncbi:MAG TPA: hypothetical protein DEB17_07160 [Chlorobaculum sp.]|jgi:hypothetical protein|uniref:Uncharacterized protein n=1 Tax=Chlorobaculum tepidum (strain ATCC 49652 / DSM 12025 / NBRC 103806 / TLS) TaxID=194439 RepID=Q8KFP5_CHLTE|nr:hypothetical protein [Chlorobaculum tepidum]AAM71523.1 hypothetical protein CT0277 [Chlorobaculum tepidum TLS]HBU23751.1 hypothetical protein [Chlorobaculum sp.]
MNRTTEQRNAEVMKTIGLLDQMPRVEVDHLFRVRLMQRIEAMEVKKTSWSALPGGAFNPRLAFMALLLMLNIASALMLFMHGTPQATGSSGAIAESLTEDYGGPALSYYDDQTTIDR